MWTSLGEQAVTDVVEVSAHGQVSPVSVWIFTSQGLSCIICLFSEKTTEAKMMKAGGTEIGKTLAEKSRGLFSANDWQCKTYVLQIAVCYHN